jgi:predicted enzyme related to lactoylglutathione lyase
MSGLGRGARKELGMGNPLVHFEFVVGDVSKSKEFYGKIFDWKFKDDPAMDYTMIDTGKNYRPDHW